MFDIYYPEELLIVELHRYATQRPGAAGPGALQSVRERTRWVGLSFASRIAARDRRIGTAAQAGFRWWWWWGGDGEGGRRVFRLTSGRSDGPKGNLRGVAPAGNARGAGGGRRCRLVYGPHRCAEEELEKERGW